VGVFFAYGSYNPIKQTVIGNAVIIALVDFLFSFLAGFIAWGAIGYLEVTKDPAYEQTQSVGLTFIAMPAVAARMEKEGEYNHMDAFYGCFLFLMFVAGIDSSFSYVESLVCNILDLM